MSDDALKAQRIKGRIEGLEKALEIFQQDSFHPAVSLVHQKIREQNALSENLNSIGWDRVFEKLDKHPIESDFELDRDTSQFEEKNLFP